MKHIQRLALLCLLVSLVALSASAQRTSQKNSNESKRSESGESSSTSGLRKMKTNRGIDEVNTQIDQHVDAIVNQTLKTVAAELKQLDIRLEAMEVDLGDLDIELEPLDIEMPEIEIDLEDFKIEIPEMDIHITTDKEDFSWRTDSDHDDDENGEDNQRSKAVNKLTTDDSKAKDKALKPADQEKAKGLKKVN
ncbi:MAG: hypothetical protein C0523_11410 [Cytophaga sp.]|nr:hypothetical protein [Cytophaga sp.]